MPSRGGGRRHAGELAGQEAKAGGSPQDLLGFGVEGAEAGEPG